MDYIPQHNTEPSTDVSCEWFVVLKFLEEMQ